MMFVSGALGRPEPGTANRVALLGLLLALMACAGPERPATAPSAPAGAASAPEDPLGRFVAGAAPGQAGMVALPDGRTAQVRVVRAYAAASGRECREVLVGEGMGGRASLLCQSDGQWVAARPLLVGSGAARP